MSSIPSISDTEPLVRPRSLPVVIAAATIPFLVVGQFAMLAVVPVVIVLVGSHRNKGLAGLRRWADGLAAVYALSLVLWAAGPDRAPSLSKDIHPVVAALIVAAAAAVVLRYALLRRAR